MSKINFEEDVVNIDQDSLESVSELLRQQLRMEAEIELNELDLKNLKEKHRKLIAKPASNLTSSCFKGTRHETLQGLA